VSEPQGPGLDEGRPRGGRSLAFDAALALLAIGVGLVEVTPADGQAAAAVLLIVAAGGALALRRSAPLVVLVTALGAATALALSTPRPATRSRPPA
jgi:hypothetical protein